MQTLYTYVFLLNLLNLPLKQDSWKQYNLCSTHTDPWISDWNFNRSTLIRALGGSSKHGGCSQVFLTKKSGKIIWQKRRGSKIVWKKMVQTSEFYLL